jgi:L,D-transpeptidase ErfK/SrfK
MSRSLFLSIILLGPITACVHNAAHATTYALPKPEDAVIGEIQYITSRYEDTLMELGRKYGVGYEEMVSANPGVDPWLPGEGTRITIPTRFVLPVAPRNGIVVNLPEHRIYYYPATKKGEGGTVQTYPISIGKMDWKTPLGKTRVVNKQVKPIWFPPESVRKEHEENGEPLPKAVPPGKDNPLGEFAMRLGIPGGSYLIHGTNKPEGIGMDVTHGCMRMFPEDIEVFFKAVPVQTPV